MKKKFPKKQYENSCKSSSAKIRRKIFKMNKNFISNNNSYIAHLFYKNSNNINSSFIKKKKKNYFKNNI